MKTPEPFYVERTYPATGVTNRIDELIARGFDAIEISWRLQIPTWIARDRFTHRAGQYEVA